MRRNLKRLNLVMVMTMLIIMVSSTGAMAVAINGFDVFFEGRTYDPETDTTTYVYIVSGSNHAPALNYFTISLPYCDEERIILSSYPRHGVKIGTDDNTGIDGIKWVIGLPPHESRVYTVTLVGEYGTGVIDAAVKAGRDAEIGQVTGPSCELEPPAMHTISGLVFFDVNINGFPDD